MMDRRVVSSTLQGALVDDRVYSERLASIARIVQVLGDQLAADGAGGRPSPALVAELTQLVVRLDRDVNDGHPDTTSEGRALRFATAAFSTSELPGAAAGEPWARPASTDAGGRTPCGAAGAHGVHFSRSHEHAVAAVVDMVCEAIDLGRSVVVVATGLHRRWIETELHHRGIQLEGEACHVLDAGTTLSSILVDGTPDRERFRTIVGTLVTELAARAPAGVSVYGEMVGLLWERGDAAAALRLEELWNELQRDVAFTLLCGYLVCAQTDARDLEPIRRLHSHVA